MLPGEGKYGEHLPAKWSVFFGCHKDGGSLLSSSTSNKSPQTLDTSNLVTLFPPPWIPSLEISGMLASSTLILAKGAGCGTNSLEVSGVRVVSCFPGAVRLLKALARCRSCFGTSWGMEDTEGYLGLGLPSDKLQILQKQMGDPRGQTAPLELRTRQTSFTEPLFLICLRNGGERGGETEGGGSQNIPRMDGTLSKFGFSPKQSNRFKFFTSLSHHGLSTQTFSRLD